MIPKIIHYCWFGRGQLDAKALKCIESWKKYFPDYEIIQWNEDNFDISSCDFMFKAYADKKWAFVSDVARLMIIYEHGGIYFDTDVEVIRPYDDIVTSDADGFIGLESTMQVASGLGFGAKKQTPFLKELLSVYNSLSYDDYKNDLSSIACTIITTSLMKEKGFSGTNQLQRVAGFDIYPIDYFSPIEYHTGKLRKTSNTHSIHWYNASWWEKSQKKAFKTTQRLASIIGPTAADHLIGIISCIKNEGFVHYIKKRIEKYL